MASVVEICSNALGLLGDDPIVSLTEDNARARLCNRFYANMRDAVLRSHPWNCAKERQALAQLSTAPGFGYTYQYTLPTNPYCLRVWQLNDKTAAFKIEGRKLLADISEVSILYIARITDPNRFDALLYAALEWRLAMQMAIPLKGSRQLFKDMAEGYKAVLFDAKAVDGMESPRDQVIVDALTSVR